MQLFEAILGTGSNVCYRLNFHRHFFYGDGIAECPSLYVRSNRVDVSTERQVACYELLEIGEVYYIV